MTRSRDIANPLATGRRTGLAAYAAAIAILALQFVGPLHLEQHDVTDVTETCAACAQLEQNGLGLVATPPTAAFLPASEPVPAIETIVTDARTLTGYSSRAPPLTA